MILKMAKISTLKSIKQIPGASQLYQSRKCLFHMLREIYRGNYKPSLLTSLSLIFGFLYIISPLDFDWIPILGWIDDGFVFYLMVKRLQAETQRYSRYKAMERRK